MQVQDLKDPIEIIEKTQPLEENSSILVSKLKTLIARQDINSKDQFNLTIECTSEALSQLKIREERAILPSVKDS